jgi:hypothetical protein
VINGENHCVLCAQQLQKQSSEVDPEGTVWETDLVQLASKEVGLTVQGASKKKTEDR